MSCIDCDLPITHLCGTSESFAGCGQLFCREHSMTIRPEGQPEVNVCRPCCARYHRQFAIPRGRILFLDIDGVINHKNFLMGLKDADREQWGMARQFDPRAITLVNHIIAATGCDVVISSAWRGTPKLAEMLKGRGFEGNVVGLTPRFHCEKRGTEIQWWLDAFGVEADRILILDDDDDMVHLMPRLVRTSFETGITEAHVAEAIALFQG